MEDMLRPADHAKGGTYQRANASGTVTTYGNTLTGQQLKKIRVEANLVFNLHILHIQRTLANASMHNNY